MLSFRIKEHIEVTRRQEGFALILTLIITSAVLAIGLSMLSITLRQLDLGATAQQSEKAFDAASAAMNCLIEARNTQASTILQGNTINNLKCFDKSYTLQSTKTVGGGNETYQYQVNSGTADWDVNGDGKDLRCVRLDMTVYNASSSDMQMSVKDPTGGFQTCIHGDVCTVANASGYNVACAELSSPNRFITEREIQAEF